jgi:hypothetical protein
MFLQGFMKWCSDFQASKCHSSWTHRPLKIRPVRGLETSETSQSVKRRHVPITPLKKPKNWHLAVLQRTLIRLFVLRHRTKCRGYVALMVRGSFFTNNNVGRDSLGPLRSKITAYELRETSVSGDCDSETGPLRLAHTHEKISFSRKESFRALSR